MLLVLQDDKLCKITFAFCLLQELPMRCSALIQEIVLEDDCIVTFKPVALFTQAIAELVQNGDYLFFI